MKPHHEYIAQELNSSIHAFIYENSAFETPWHYHQEYELTYIVKGSGIRYIGNSIDDFYAGDLVLVGRSLPHCWKNDTQYTDGVLSIGIQWNHEILHQFIAASIELHSIQTLFQQAQFGVRLMHQPTDHIAEKLREIVDLAPNRRLLAFLRLLLDLSELSEKEVLSGIKEVTGKVDLPTDTRIQDILNYIDNHYQKKIAIKKMASLTCMTEVSFCKFFKRRFHKSFTNYLNEFRIRKTCQMLRETNHKLADIAMSCGYENMSFFHRQFKKYLGHTPNEYRGSLF